MSEHQHEPVTLPMLRTSLLARVVNRVQWLAQPWLVQLLLRLAIAVPFLKSGLLKWQGFLQLNETAVYLFTDEFRLHLPGGPYPFPAPASVAFLAACGEVLLPALLILGLGTRLAALGIVLMTIVIQFTVPEGWPVHLTWVAIALAIAAWGPGRVSIDYWLGDRDPRSL